MEKIILIDGAGLLYRSFFALPPSLTDPEGRPTNAVLGFTNILLNLLLTHKPDYIAIAFDKKGPTFRHKEYKDYKATRAKQPQILYDQIPMAKEVIEAFQIPLFEMENYEADDILATVALKLTKKDMEILIATGDFDVFQVVHGPIKILYPEKSFKESKIITSKEVMEKYGITPAQIPDYKGLCGDSSDNIPGVTGVGPKTAQELIQRYGSLEKIYDHLDKLPEGIRKKMEAGKESAFFSRKLATLVSEVPLKFSLEECRVSKLDPKKIVPVLEKFGFRALLKRLGLVTEEEGKKKIAENQIALF